ncbi:MAG: ArgE/DapE family deacylase [Roseiflexaceae bacterium]
MAQVDVVQLLADLVAIDSRNPALSEGVPGEPAIIAYVADFVQRHGFEYVLLPPEDRPSILAWKRGSGGAPGILLNGHIDTVDFGDMVEPTTPHIRDGRLYGRGSFDMKGGVATILAAAADATEQQALRGDLVLAIVSDEEHASIGTEAAMAALPHYQLSPAYGIVAEPTDEQLCVAHKGFVWATIETRGRAAHGSAWQEGIDAIAHMGRVIVALEALDQHLHQRPSHTLLGIPSLHMSLIQGGIGLSTYPQHCRLEIERRTVPGETLAQVQAEIEAILAAQHAADPQFSAQISWGLARSPMEADQQSAIVTALRSASTAVVGHEPALFGMSGWTDAALMADAGIASVLYGTTGAGAHADIEWVDLASLARCRDSFVQVIRSIAG